MECGKFLLPHRMILLELRGFCIFMEDNPYGIQH